jgi:signal transduction histidine kinase
LAEQKVNAVICFPVHDAGRIAGTLCIMSYREESFDDFHCAMVKLLLGYVAVALDNAMRHDELNRTRIRAEQGEKFKEQFLANMSHEIRTPINAVTGMTRLLLDKQPRTDQMKYLESIRNASDSLLVIVNDILDLAKIEAGKIELERIDFSVRQVAEHVQELMNYKAEEKGLMLETVTDEKLPPVLVGDPNRLTQVLINLAANAVKFTTKGKVTLRIFPANDSVATTGDQPTIPIVFEVSDTGIGMSPEQQSRLFSDYAQAGADTARKYGGTGLGLSISRRLVKLQGGNLEVKSQEGKGSVFYFTLNFAISPHAEIRQTAFVAGPELLAVLRVKAFCLPTTMNTTGSLSGKRCT